ncbi:ftsZ-interacting protein A [Coriobacteriaceae bacterium EMTCatB1]|nr:ftsZ-interacting protein A [Coriobacteriaceae bacterium EMTCatB1]
MADVVLLFGRLLFLALLYLFLFAAVRTGIGLVATGRTAAVRTGLELEVVRGPKELKGVRVPLDGPVIIGRSPDADLVIADGFVSALHARVTPDGSEAIVEDLGSTNGTVLDGQPVTRPLRARAGSRIVLGQNEIAVVKP